MNKSILIIIALFFFNSCGQQKRQDDEQSDNSKKSQSEFQIPEEKADKIREKKVGQDLFKAINDTIKEEKVSADLLINNKWIFNVEDICESYLKFEANGKGISYCCEIPEESEITYKIEDNKVLIAEYGIPHVDNVERKKIKLRDDTYIYNGHSLIMVDSKMYNIGGLEWMPDIEVVIHYDKE